MYDYESEIEDLKRQNETLEEQLRANRDEILRLHKLIWEKDEVHLDDSERDTLMALLEKSILKEQEAIEAFPSDYQIHKARIEKMRKLEGKIMAMT